MQALLHLKAPSVISDQATDCMSSLHVVSQAISSEVHSIALLLLSLQDRLIWRCSICWVDRPLYNSDEPPVGIHWPTVWSL